MKSVIFIKYIVEGIECLKVSDIVMLLRFPVKEKLNLVFRLRIEQALRKWKVDF